MTRNQKRLDAWENGTELAQFVLAALFLFAYSVLILDRDLSQAFAIAFGVIIAVVWAAFLGDYILRFTLSSPKLKFFQHNLIDLASVFFPVARAFLLLKYLRKLPFLRTNSGASVRSRVVIYAATFVVLFVYIISLAELRAERDAPGATIVSFGDSIWWACVTLATVGYGDYVPVTITGRVLAVLLMIGGVAIIGTASATIVSYLGERIGPRHGRAFGMGADRTSSESTQASDGSSAPSAGVSRGGSARPRIPENRSARQSRRKPAWARKTSRPPQ
jgi:voltage-gated potassium channel